MNGTVNQCNASQGWAQPSSQQSGWEQPNVQQTGWGQSQQSLTPPAPVQQPIWNTQMQAPVSQAPMVTQQAPIVNQQVPMPVPTNQSQTMSENYPMPETLTNPIYIPGYLRGHIGSLVRVEFLLGGSFTDRVGTLAEVGSSYIVLDSLEQHTKILCDIFSIRFVTIVESDIQKALMASF